MRNTRQYDKQFRINAVKHLKSSDKSLREVAEDLGVPKTTLRGWEKEYDQNEERSFPGSGNTKPCNEEYYRLKKGLEDGTISAMDILGIESDIDIYVQFSKKNANQQAALNDAKKFIKEGIQTLSDSAYNALLCPPADVKENQ